MTGRGLLDRVLGARSQARASFGGGPSDDDGPDDDDGLGNDDGDDRNPPKAPRRLRLAIAFPIAAALVTATYAYVHIEPETYQASATVIVPAGTQCVSTVMEVPTSAPVLAANAFSQCVSTFQHLLTSAPVVNQVSSQTGERKNDLVSGLTATITTGSRTKILVTYTGPNRKTVQDVVQHATVDSLDALLGPQVSASAQALQIADQNVADFATKTGYSFPDVDYKIQQQELNHLNRSLKLATLANDSPRVRGLTSVIAVRNADLVQLAAKVVDYQGLKEAQLSAQAKNNKAQVDLNSAKGSVGVKFIGKVSRDPDIVLGGVAAGVAILLSLGYIFFIESLNGRDDISPDAV